MHHRATSSSCGSLICAACKATGAGAEQQMGRAGRAGICFGGPRSVARGRLQQSIWLWLAAWPPVCAPGRVEPPPPHLPLIHQHTTPARRLLNQVDQTIRRSGTKYVPNLQTPQNLTITPKYENHLQQLPPVAVFHLHQIEDSLHPCRADNSIWVGCPHRANKGSLPPSRSQTRRPPLQRKS